MPEWLTPLVTALIVGPAGWLTARATRRTADHQRIKALEERVDTVERRNVILWRYNRELVNHIYEGKPPPPPVMPDDIA